MLEYKKIIPKFNNILNDIIRILIILIIGVIYINVDIEFDMRVPFMFVELYFIEKIFMDKDSKKLFLNRKFNDKWRYVILKILYISLIEVSFISSLDFSAYHPRI